MGSGCSECEGRRYRVGAVGAVAQARLCMCAESCSACEGRGCRLASAEAGGRTYHVMAECECRALRRRVQRFNAASIPGALAHATFGNFAAGSEALARALRVARGFAEGFRPGQATRGFVLAGPVGTGKSHLLAAALAYLTLEVGARCEYVEVSLLYATIRRGFQEGKSGGEIIQPLSEVEVLGVDELGKGRGSAFELDTLEELVARRYNAQRPTLFTTNYLVESAAAPGPVRGYRSTEATRLAAEAGDSQVLRERVGARTESRLHEMCELVQLPANLPDWRKRAGAR